MRLTFVAPFDEPRHIEAHAPAGRTLGDLCGPHRVHVTGCQVNGVFVEAWQDYLPRASDHATFFVETGFALTTATGALTFFGYAVLFAATTAVSIGLQYGLRALQGSQAVAANTAGKTEQIFGIAGLTNTTALGTPKFLVYGTRRVFGHIINTSVKISDDGKTTMFGILYFMGEGPIAGLSAFEINDTPLAQFAGVQAHVRLGDGNTEPIPGFDTFSAVWSDGRPLPVETAIVYATRGSDVERVTLILSTPFLFSQTAMGEHRPATHTLAIAYATLASGVYIEAPNSPYAWTDTTESPRFLPFLIQFDHADSWLIRVSLNATTNTQDAVPALYNVQEEASGAQRYPTSALLAFTGIASAQIGSFEAMRGSALAQGRLVTVFDGATYTQAWSDNRAWILRDLLTNPLVGLGHRIPASLFDDDAALVAATYWDSLAATIRRDRCDVLINDRRAAWDWLKTILTEGRAILIPSGGLFKLVVDRESTPHLLYSMPGNIVEGSVTHTFGDGQGEAPNTIRGQFPDELANDRLQILEVSVPDIGTEPVRETLVTIYTLTSLARVYWLLRYQLLRTRLVQRHVSWSSPATALVSEPLDQVSLAYETPDFERGFSGFCPAGSTATRLLLDRLVTLTPSTPYALLVRHQADNSVERTTLDMGAGTWGAVVPAAPLAQPPAEGDLWAVGVLDTSIVPVVIESVTLQGEGQYALTGSRYEAGIHATPLPPPALARGPTQDRRPLPLWAVSVSEIVQMGLDGTMQLFLSFTVTPQLVTHAGTVRLGPVSGTPTHVHLQSDEPTPRELHLRMLGTMDQYYVGATFTTTGGTGAGQSLPIGEYICWLIEPTLQSFPYIITQDFVPFDPPLDDTTTYTITWPYFTETTGFLVEQMVATEAYLGGPWTPVVALQALHGVVPAPTSGDSIAYRFTPLAGTVRNETARWIVVYTVQGDLGAPAAPSDSLGERGV